MLLYSACASRVAVPRRKPSNSRGTAKFINPRDIESASSKTGEVVQIKPDTDLYLMAALLNEMKQMNLWDMDVVEKHGSNIESLIRFIQPYNADTVSDVVGIACNHRTSC